jgi:hypothetical protein
VVPIEFVPTTQTQVAHLKLDGTPITGFNLILQGPPIPGRRLTLDAPAP